MARDQQIPVEVVLGVSVVFAGLAYPVTGTALDLTSPALIAVARALVGGLIMLPVLRGPAFAPRAPGRTALYRRLPHRSWSISEPSAAFIEVRKS
jgi:hypothetical protein